MPAFLETAHLALLSLLIVAATAVNLHPKKDTLQDVYRPSYASGLALKLDSSGA